MSPILGGTLTILRRSVTLGGGLGSKGGRLLSVLIRGEEVVCLCRRLLSLISRSVAPARHGIA